MTHTRLRRAAWLALASALSCGTVSAQQQEFQVTGIGGAGGMYTPAVSPLNPNLMLVSCDMGGSYRSTDGGLHWQLIPWQQLNSSTGCRPLFLNNAIVWVHGAMPSISHDQGATWTPLANGRLPWQGEVIRLAAAPGSSAILLVGTSYGEVWRTTDGGNTWTLSQKAERVYDILALGRKIYVAAGDRFLISSSNGATWVPVDLSTSEPGGKAATFLSLAGGTAAGNTVLYGLLAKLGLYQSRDEGRTWKKVDQFRDCNQVLMAANQTQVAYEAMTDFGGATRFFRTQDGGQTWESTFRMNGPTRNVDLSWVQTQLHWGYTISSLGVGVSPSDARTALLTTQGDFYVTHDAGASWRPVMDTPVPPPEGEAGPWFRSNGLEVTSTWGYYIDPFDPRRTYIAYTDIGFCRSLDRGASWANAVAGCPWSNTIYNIAFDPFVPGRLYAACSNRHDIPHWTHTDANAPSHAGGVCVSDDFGRSWKVLGKGLPALPCTSVCVDPRSTRDRLTLYTTLYEGGVYRSTDGGSTWTAKSRGLGNPGNMHALAVRVHPKTGALFCGITAMRRGARDFPVPGGIWKSTDAGESWVDITSQLKLHWPAGFAVDPTDENIIYLTAATIPGGAEGGIYRTTDGGKNWKRLLKDEDFARSSGPDYVQALYVNLDPRTPQRVYLGTESHGLWTSPDGGNTWKRIEALPFVSVTNVCFDPADPTVINVCTFGGGVWRGPAPRP